MENRLADALERIAPRFGRLTKDIVFRINERGENALAVNPDNPAQCYVIKLSCQIDDDRLLNEYQKLKTLEPLSPACTPKALYYGEYPEYTLLVKEYFPGMTLREMRAARGGMSEKSVRALTLSLLKYLERVRKMGLLCYDLKPENVVITCSGQPYIIDMDTARTEREAAEHNGVCLISEGYAAPEQYGCQAMDERTDVYALGKLVTYLLTGESALPARVLSRISRPMRAFLRKCTAFSPDDRYISLAKARAALIGRRRAVARVCAILLSVLAITLFAVWLHTPKIYMDGRCYFSLTEALDAVQIDGTGKMLLKGDFELNDTLALTFKTIQLSGKGMISASKPFADPLRALIEIGLLSTLVIEPGVKITNAESAYTIINHGNLVIDGGAVENLYREPEQRACAIQTFDDSQTVLYSGEVTMNCGDAPDAGGAKWAIIHESKRSLNILGGTITAINCDGGILNYGPLVCVGTIYIKRDVQTGRGAFCVNTMEGGVSFLNGGAYLFNDAVQPLYSDN